MIKILNLFSIIKTSQTTITIVPIHQEKEKELILTKIQFLKNEWLKF